MCFVNQTLRRSWWRWQMIWRWYRSVYLLLARRILYVKGSVDSTDSRSWPSVHMGWNSALEIGTHPQTRPPSWAKRTQTFRKKLLPLTCSPHFSSFLTLIKLFMSIKSCWFLCAAFGYLRPCLQRQKQLSRVKGFSLFMERHETCTQRALFPKKGPAPYIIRAPPWK